MAEIKSAIELAMERTKNLVMDEKEKKEFAQRDLEERLRAAMRRFLEGMIGRDEFQAEYRAIKADRMEKNMLLVDMVIAEFGLEGDKEGPFELLRILGEETGGGLAGEAAALRDQFREEMKGDVSHVREAVMKAPRTDGHYWRSVEPNIEEWDEWKDAARKRGGLFKKRLYEWKDKAARAPL